MIKQFNRTVLCAGVALALAGCVTPNEVAMQVGAPPELKKGEGEKATTVNLRALQVRRFEAPSERALLRAATQTMQDLGFVVSESSVDAGVLVGSKKRDAEESGQVGGAIATTVVMALLGVHVNPTWDKEQDIVMTLVTTPVANSRQIEVRVSFDRRMTNNYGHLWRAELVTEEDIYQEFFNKLSQATFIGVHTS